MLNTGSFQFTNRELSLVNTNFFLSKKMSYNLVLTKPRPNELIFILERRSVKTINSLIQLWLNLDNMFSYQ